MPYSYKKVGDQYCVYKKDGGKKVGCTDGNKTALKKYLAALHINAKEHKEPGVFDIIREHLFYEADTAFNTKDPIPLSQVAANPAGANAAVGGGVEDEDPNDDKVAGKKASVAVKDLKPAQTEIIKEKAFGLAIGMLLKGKWDGIDLGSIISSDNYIMDGHHRWAAVSLIDPNAKIQATAIDLPGGPLITALNVVTVGKIGIKVGNKGKGNVSDFTGDKFQAVIDDALANGVKGEFPITADKIKMAMGKVPGANGDANKGKELMMKNADALPKQIMPGAPPRVDMPVIDGDKVAMVQKMLEKGLIDLQAPYSQKVQKTMKVKETKLTRKDLKILKELSFTSAGIPELIQFVYEKQQQVLPKLGFGKFENFLKFIQDGDQEEHQEVLDIIQTMNIPGAEKLIAESKKKESTDVKLARILVRKYIREAMEGEEDKGEQPDPDKVHDEPGLDDELAEITDLYIKKLKNAQAAVDQSDVIEIIALLLDSFGYGNQDKLTVLQGAKEKAVR